MGHLPGGALRASRRARRQGGPRGRGGSTSGNDAKNTTEIQAANVEALIAANVDVLVINAVDPEAILPSVQKAVDAGIPVIAYDRELENEKALFLTHDNVEVGRMIATSVTEGAANRQLRDHQGRQGRDEPDVPAYRHGGDPQAPRRSG